MVKIDIGKAYDSDKWSFLKIVVLEFGFPLKFFHLVLKYVTTVRYFLIINGGLTQ